MPKHSLRIFRNVSREKWKKSRAHKKIDYLTYKEMMSRLFELMGKEVVDNNEGLHIPGWGRFQVLKYKIKPGKDGKVAYTNFHSNGYVFRVKFFPDKRLPNKNLYEFMAHREFIKHRLRDKIFSGKLDYNKESWSS